MDILRMILLKQQEKHEKMIMGKDFSICPYIVNFKINRFLMINLNLIDNNLGRRYRRSTQYKI